MRAAATTLTILALGAAFSLMLAVAVRSRDWPGWDEGWALVVFPLGIPVAIVVGLAASLRNVAPSRVVRLGLGATLAVWFWGAAIFAAWYALG
ncbi:MAG: hypothetical protein MSC30_04970 [Gaiellaceae bacterium MAG52_C11]|nr:hypothetical protein [Candidatus Gaiellasilicea maunaloa]